MTKANIARDQFIVHVRPMEVAARQMVWIEFATEDAAWRATRAATQAATSDATWDATHAAIQAATWDATRAATWATTLAATRDATRDSIEAITQTLSQTRP